MTVHSWLPDKTLFTIIFIECRNHFASHLEQSNPSSWQSIMTLPEIFLVLFHRQMYHKFRIQSGTYISFILCYIFYFHPLISGFRIQSHWLSDAGVRLYDDILNQLCDDIKDVPLSVINSQEFLYDVIKGLQTARIRRDEESTNSFIQQLVIKFFIAYDRSQIESKYQTFSVVFSK